jgi:hypothetical protein
MRISSIPKGTDRANHFLYLRLERAYNSSFSTKPSPFGRWDLLMKISRFSVLPAYKNPSFLSSLGFGVGRVESCHGMAVDFWDSTRVRGGVRRECDRRDGLRSTVDGRRDVGIDRMDGSRLDTACDFNAVNDDLLPLSLPLRASSSSLACMFSLVIAYLEETG